MHFMALFYLTTKENLILILYHSRISQVGTAWELSNMSPHIYIPLNLMIDIDLFCSVVEAGGSPNC